MSKKLLLGLGLGLVFLISVVSVVVVYINVNDDANTRLETIDGMKSKVEVSLDNMNKVLTSQGMVVKGEKEAFLEFQRLVSESKKGQTIGGIMTAVNEKYPSFEIKGFDKLMVSIEAKRDDFAIVQNQYNSHIVEYNKFIVKTINGIFLSDKHTKLEQFVVSSKSAKSSMITGEDELNDFNL